MIAALLARLPRPGRRRRPVVVPPVAHPADMAELGYGRRCAQLTPTGTEVKDVVRTYQDAHPGRVFRNMQAIPSGQHRPRVTVEFVGDDDTPTQVIRLTTDTVAWPRVLPALLTPAGAR